MNRAPFPYFGNKVKAAELRVKRVGRRVLIPASAIDELLSSVEGN